MRHLACSPLLLLLLPLGLSAQQDSSNQGTVFRVTVNLDRYLPAFNAAARTGEITSVSTSEPPGRAFCVHPVVVIW